MQVGGGNERGGWGVREGAEGARPAGGAEWGWVNRRI